MRRVILPRDRPASRQPGSICEIGDRAIPNDRAYVSCIAVIIHRGQPIVSNCRSAMWGTWWGTGSRIGALRRNGVAHVGCIHEASLALTTGNVSVSRGFVAERRAR